MLKMRKSYTKDEDISFQELGDGQDSLEPFIPVINAVSFRDLKKKHCDICSDGVSYKDDVLQTCNKCYSNGHKTCYGLSSETRLDPDWVCERCEFASIENLDPATIHCYLCKDIKGLMKRLECGFWVHIICVLYIPEIHFSNKKKNNIDLKKLDIDKLNKICSLCGEKKGYCIQCDEEGCTENFHVRCARKMGLIEHWKIMDQRKVNKYAI
jgi:NuA3 HAT complex component NTO1